MAEETKKRAMDLDGDGKVTAKEALEYSTGKIKEDRQRLQGRPEGGQG